MMLILNGIDHQHTYYRIVPTTPDDFLVFTWD
jgi:hypothetical protein